MQREAAELLEGCERHYLEPLSAAERRQLLELLGRLVARDVARTGKRGREMTGSDVDRLVVIETCTRMA